MQIAFLVTQVLVALLVWRYYRTRIFPLSMKYSTFGPRFWTGTVDSCVLWPIGFAAFILQARELPPAVFMAISIAGNLIWLLYTVIMHAKYGQTYGKMACKVRVIDFKTEGPISYRQAFLREGIPIAFCLGLVFYEIYAIFSGALSQESMQVPVSLLSTLQQLWFVAEVITMLTNEKRRALHDFIAGTVVVRTNIGELLETYMPIERDYNSIKLTPPTIDYSDRYNTKKAIKIVMIIITLMLVYIIWSTY